MKIQLTPEVPYGFTLPDPRWEMPALLTPGRQPLGKVKVDWSHPLARGLKAFMVGDQYWSTTGELVRITPKYEGSDKGLVYRSDTVGQKIEIGSKPAVGTPAFSVFAIAKMDNASRATAPDEAVVSYGRSQINWASTFAGVSQSYTVKTADNNWYKAAFIIPANANIWYTFGFSHNTVTGDITGYRDGKYDNTQGTPSGMMENGVGLIPGVGSTNASDTLNGIIPVCYAWDDRELTAEDHASLAKDPYQFLVPV